MNLALAPTIEQYTADHSHFDSSRPYIQLSNCSAGEQEIIHQYYNGFTDSKEIRLKCYKGYQMEKDLKERLVNIYGNRISTTIEVVAFDGLVKGHPDFTFDSYPGDCKSVLMDEWLPKEHQLPRRVFWQMQGYMLYMSKPVAVVIYESRESGKIQDHWIKAHKPTQQLIDEKLTRIVNQIKGPATLTINNA